MKNLFKTNNLVEISHVSKDSEPKKNVPTPGTSVTESGLKATQTALRQIKTEQNLNGALIVYHVGVIAITSALIYGLLSGGKK